MAAFTFNGYTTCDRNAFHCFPKPSCQFSPGFIRSKFLAVIRLLTKKLFLWVQNFNCNFMGMCDVSGPVAHSMAVFFGAIDHRLFMSVVSQWFPIGILHINSNQHKSEYLLHNYFASCLFHCKHINLTTKRHRWYCVSSEYDSVFIFEEFERLQCKVKWTLAMCTRTQCFDQISVVARN